MSSTLVRSRAATSKAETTSPSSILLHPHRYDPAQFDAETRRLLTATIKWFEQRGLHRLLEDFHARRYYTEFLEFLAKEKVIATFLIPARDADGEPAKRWDTARISALSEITGLAPVSDPDRFDRVWQQVAELSGSYTMNPGVPQPTK